MVSGRAKEQSEVNNNVGPGETQHKENDDGRETADWTDFHPHPLLRSPILQTAVSSVATLGGDSVLARERLIVLDAGQDYTGMDDSGCARLMAYYNHAWGEKNARGTVVLFHGWEGSSHSTYGLIMAESLLRAGYDTFRLNLRDHGPEQPIDPYALNRGVFVGTLIEETEAAVRQISSMAARPIHLVGPSMGGNFVLRLAGRHASQPIPGLGRVVAISPAVDPAEATRAIDRRVHFRYYFRTKWLRSLSHKARLYPDIYDFAPLHRMHTIWEMTEWLVRRYDLYESAAEYFSQYTVGSAALRNLTAPTFVITAADDQVIPVSGIRSLPSSDQLKVHILPYGGHVGFVDLPPLRHRLPDMVLALLEESSA